MRSSSCEAAFHDGLKVDRAVYEASTYVIGWQDAGDGSEYELANCKICSSTLADGTERQRIALRKAA